MTAQQRLTATRRAIVAGTVVRALLVAAATGLVLLAAAAALDLVLPLSIDVRAALRGAVVVFCSDGLERGDPELLRVQMARLRRLAHRVIWVNPLKGSPRYEPLARGMVAALPSVDVFLSGHNLESLEHLAATLGT